jgi:hypothetical protein
MTEMTVEVFGVRIDIRCAALLDIALNGPNWGERKYAIDKLANLGCHLALGIVAKKGINWGERKYAMDMLA